MQIIRVKFSTGFFELFILPGFLVSLFFSQCFAQDTGHGTLVYPVWQGWKTVGHSTLTWGFWAIYDAQLRTPSGLYRGDDPFASDIALMIDYRRTISKKSLLSATDEQWLHLGVSRENRERWIPTLAQIWRDVRRGDRLVFVLTEFGGSFYSGDDVIGHIDDLLLARAFIDIWLSEKTTYPELRRQLIGQR